jgi:glycosyltransferase involved in cell wall biosynthesis
MPERLMKLSSRPAADSGNSVEDLGTSRIGHVDFSAPVSPYVPQVGVVAMVPYRWSNIWQPCNHVLTRLARYFHVVWVNPAHQWSDALLNREALSVPAHDAGPGFAVYQPEFWLPDVYRPRALARWVFRQRLAHAREMLLRRGCSKIVLYLWRPQFGDAMTSMPFDLSCYHIDDEYSFSPVDIPIPESEKRLIAQAGQVFIHSPALLEKKGNINPHTAFVPNGVDFQSYAQPVPEPADIAEIPHPRIGYSGHIKKQLDWPLLLDLTARHPEWSFVFVGAPNRHPEIVAHIDQLSRRPNVRFLGSKSVQELATYPQHFDVCLMPYARNDYTKYIYPLKLHEYLASGRPVVGAPIASLEPFRHLVKLPETSEQWSAAIAESLGPVANSTEQRTKRQAAAKQHDWEILVRQIAETMSLRLGPDYSSRINLEPSVEALSLPGSHSS